MTKKILYLINIPSTIAFFLLLASDSKISLVIAFTIGMIIGIGEYLYLRKAATSFKEIHSPLSILLGIVLCFFGAKSFCHTWINSTNTMKTVITKVFSDYSQGLITVSVVLAIISLPFCSWLIGVFVQAFRLLDYKELWKSLSGKNADKAALKSIGTVIINLILAAFIGTLLLTGAYMLPVHSIDNNVRTSAEIIDKEGTYPNLNRWFTSQLDNFTDSLMLLEAACRKVASPIEDAMNVPRGYIENLFPDAAMTAHYVQGVEFDKVGNYPRYWHGYLIILKPLLHFFDFGTVRIINGIVQILLVILTSCLLFKKNLKAAIIPYILAYCMLMPIALAKTFQFSSCFYVMTIGSIFLLLLPFEKLKTNSYIVFLYCGILTAYFDLLTYPIATFGVPIAFYLLLMPSESTEKKIGNIVRKGFTWCIGFGCMWVAKWLIGSIITGNNVIVDGLERVAERTASTSVDGTEQFGLLQCEAVNFKAFFKTPVTICLVICVAYLIFKCYKKNRYSAKYVVRILLPFFLVSLIPVAWYAFALNHSVVHYWFTNKATITFVLAILFGLVALSQLNESQADEVLADSKNT